MSTNDDPFDSAQNATLPPAVFYGEIKADAWYAALVKGQGKVPFDPSTHAADKRVTAIDLVITPLPEQNVTNAKATERHLIAESRDWAGIVLPSLKTHALDLRGLSGRHVKVECVPNGKQYKNAKGELKDETVFKLVAVYADEAACRAAYFADGNKDRREGASDAVSTEATPVAQATGDDKEKNTAYQFLVAIVRNAAKGQTEVAAINTAVQEQIVKYPVVSKYFTAQSPETLELIMQNYQPA